MAAKNPTSRKKQREKIAGGSNPERITPNKHPIYTKVRGGWFSVFWNMTAWAWTAISSMELEDAVWRPVIWLPTITGAGLAAIALHRYLRLRRDGPAILRLDPPQPRIGSPFRMRVECEIPPPDNRTFVVRLQCTSEESYGDGVATAVQWKSNRRMTRTAELAEASFDLPANLPPTDSQYASKINYRWSIILDRGGYTQEYDIAVQGGSPASTANG